MRKNLLSLVKKCLFRMVHPFISKYEINTDNSSTIYASIQDLEYHVSTQFTIILKQNGHYFYFREIKKSKSLKESILSDIDLFFSLFVHSEKSDIWKHLVYEDIKDKNNFKKIKDVRQLYSDNILLMRSGEFSDVRAIGIPSLNDLEFKQYVPIFVKFLRSTLGTYDLNSKVIHFSNRKYYYTYSYNRIFATRKLSELLGLFSLIPEVCLCNLVLDNNVQLFGTLMSQAGDINPNELSISNRRLVNKPEFLKEISSLEYLDSLCYQLDHRLDNYNVKYNLDGKISGVSAFDNDSLKTFFISPILPKYTYCGCSGVVKSGRLNRPFIDAQLAKTILKLDYSTIKNTLSIHLTVFQLLSLWFRIIQLKKVLIPLLNSEYFVNDWNNVDFDKALQPLYGLTYIKYYFEKDELSEVYNKLGIERKNY